MTPEEQLAQLEAKLTTHFGAWTRYRNECVEQEATSVEDRIAIATAVLRDPDRGIAGHIYECQRQKRLGWAD
jgi:hypothetical protein